MHDENEQRVKARWPDAFVGHGVDGDTLKPKDYRIMSSNAGDAHKYGVISDYNCDTPESAWADAASRLQPDAPHHIADCAETVPAFVTGATVKQETWRPVAETVPWTDNYSREEYEARGWCAAPKPMMLGSSMSPRYHCRMPKGHSEFHSDGHSTWPQQPLAQEPDWRPLRDVLLQLDRDWWTFKRLYDDALDHTQRSIWDGKMHDIESVRKRYQEATRHGTR